ncbi:hypothetical protein [Streptomyces sp. DH10]|uniref:hypothetical protein n=1 Tax=Streptomyces sp. DH10 TaxID=3040121 RepID=UPI0024419E4F|nr:hypothetical protein [Streptomyces sp. DH10]MDG9708190.1 hypothetical protein [Streptomyces sp. DH10]
MESHHLRRGQVYVPCGQSEGTAPRYVRFVHPGGPAGAHRGRGRREREVDVNRVHEFPTRNGAQRRAGDALVETSEWWS